ncbi:MAG: hypothetical protein JRF33_07530 [Deltaproteobacteria bacterium]|nr:hypothetical protein [Deltaproteobacteria bacterium]
MRNLMLTIVLLTLAGTVQAKSWMGTTPGITTRTQVINNFGKATKVFSKGGKLSDGLNYQGDEAIKGALGTNFYFDKYEVLSHIDVFPAKEISFKEILNIFGKDFKKMQTKKGHILLHYAVDGMVVFFDKSGNKVHSFKFMKGVEKKKTIEKEPSKKKKKKRNDPEADDEEATDEEATEDSAEDIETESIME